MTKLTLLLVWFIFIISNPVNAESNYKDYAIDNEIFDIPGHGEISMDVPRVWNYNFTKTDENQPPIVTFYVLDNEDEEIFQLNMSVLWDDGFSRDITSLNFIRSLVEKTGKDILPLSDETELILNEFAGSNGTGFFFDLSDSNASKGEYRYLTQGAVSLGEVILIFSLFSNDKDSLLRDAMLRTVMSAKHYFRKDV